MTKRDYEAVARLVWSASQNPNARASAEGMRAAIVTGLSTLFRVDNERFRADWFEHAALTGDMRDPRKIPPPPPCAAAMGCLCAGHARNPRRKTCDTREVTR